MKIGRTFLNSQAERSASHLGHPSVAQILICITRAASDPYLAAMSSDALLSQVFPGNFFVARVSALSDAAGSHEFVADQGPLDKSKDDDRANDNVKLAARCKYCSSSRLEHNLSIRWASRKGQFNAVESILALLQATRLFSSVTEGKSWFVQLVKQCWSSLPALSQLDLAKLRKAELVVQSSSRKTEKISSDLELAAALDEAYFSLYYEARVSCASFNVRRWAPAAVFDRLELKWCATLELRHLSPRCSAILARFETNLSQENELYRLWLARIKENLRRGNQIADLDIFNSQRRVSSADWAGRGEAPFSSASSEQWFDTLRDWPAHLYAYAVPTNEAICIITQLGSIVEIGAGTGFWASLMRKNGADLVAADIAPLLQQRDQSGTKRGKNRSKQSSRGRMNEYHGQFSAYTYIEPMAKGTHGPCMDSQWANRDVLFLCYPPPGTPMAEKTLGEFRGKYVALVGEWNGTTATQNFEVALHKSFDLYKRCTLPNWPNTANDLTIWQRKNEIKSKSNENMAHQVLKCATCERSLGQVPDLRRCALTRAICFCSLDCFEIGKVLWVDELAIRGICQPEQALDDIFENAFDLLSWPFKLPVAPRPGLCQLREKMLAQTEILQVQSEATPPCGKVGKSIQLMQTKSKRKQKTTAPIQEPQHQSSLPHQPKKRALVLELEDSGRKSKKKNKKQKFTANSNQQSKTATKKKSK